MIFVFGSNLKGIHGRGAALTAVKEYGAIRGIGEGLVGNSYALPTKITPYQNMPLDEIHKAVQRFMKYAYDHDELEFMVTQVGCGLANHNPKDIADMFTYYAHSSSNCYFDTEWKEFLPFNANFWGTYKK